MVTTTTAIKWPDAAAVSCPTSSQGRAQSECGAMQKIIHITDPHFVAPGKTLYGIDPAQRLRDTLDHVSRVHADARLILITGDLADTGDPAAYALLREILSEVRLPVHLTIGNHDDRGAFRGVFGGEGFVQAAVDLHDWLVVLLDTKDDISHFGCLDGGRFEWLQDQLFRAAGRPVVVAMHHTPADLHVPCFKTSDMKESDRLLSILRKNASVRHMLFGHRHVAAAGSLSGISFTASRGTAQHIVLDWEQYGKPIFVAAAPSYDVVMLDGSDVVVHRHEGLDQLPVIRPGDPK
ncbi:phosphodiesterase [Mesorhizobium sp. M4B.F.Ca.ET.215.01.1.1]|nr:MAG: phosphodiesterase [Mesorhizobium sp.]TGQ09201.1 phosphodiesterase [Mesorhizobium sp. M4B.F.Ca.ET.215.01.1.1]TGQ25318.1 phosphodiesterase [Mesorhizobium sp. M00.F.Ca.ET.220.01.1.1]TGQ98004.1 phosphodiesterase [Mesorhizobium sp. M4B.F.Ca.ET.203.01.1.1]RWF79718.1 MAG: phosphodiesterase [Mesorhizobium sp.]